MNHSHNNVEIGFDDTPLSIEFFPKVAQTGQQQQFQHQHHPMSSLQPTQSVVDRIPSGAESLSAPQDTPCTAFLRSSRHDRNQQLISTSSQHTCSTLGTDSLGDFLNDEFADDLDFADDSSFCADEIFNMPLNDDGAGAPTPSEMAISNAIRISNDTVEKFGDSNSTLHASFGSIQNISEDEELIDDTNVPGTNFNESMSSLNDAFEKLTACMERTAQTRKMVRQLTQQGGVKPAHQISASLGRTSSLRSLSRRGSRDGSLRRTDSNTSLSSMGSMGSHKSSSSIRSVRTSRSNAKVSYRTKMSLQRELRNNSAHSGARSVGHL